MLTQRKRKRTVEDFNQFCTFVLAYAGYIPYPEEEWWCNNNVPRDSSTCSPNHSEGWASLSSPNSDCALTLAKKGNGKEKAKRSKQDKKGVSQGDNKPRRKNPESRKNQSSANKSKKSTKNAVTLQEPQFERTNGGVLSNSPFTGKDNSSSNGDSDCKLPQSLARPLAGDCGPTQSGISGPPVFQPTLELNRCVGHWSQPKEDQTEKMETDDSKDTRGRREKRGSWDQEVKEAPVDLTTAGCIEHAQKAEPGQREREGKAEPGQREREGKAEPGQREREGKAEPGQREREGKAEPGQREREGKAEPGQRGREGKAEPGQRGREGNAEPGQRGREGNAEPGQRERSGKAEPGQREREGNAEPGQREREGKEEPGQREREGKAEPRQRERAGKAEPGQREREGKEEPGQRERAGKAEPGQREREGKEEPGQREREGNAEPGQREREGNAEPGQREREGKAEPRQRGREGKAEPRQRGREGKAEPRQRGREGKAEPRQRGREGKAEPGQRGREGKAESVKEEEEEGWEGSEGGSGGTDILRLVMERRMRGCLPEDQETGYHTDWDGSTPDRGVSDSEQDPCPADRHTTASSACGTEDASMDKCKMEDEDSWDLITCFCLKPFAGRPMIECSECGTWVHLSCAKIRRTHVPDVFVCQPCRDSKQDIRRSSRARTVPRKRFSD